MRHITKFSLENFRIFKEKTSFDFAPLTILTGPNNSGKSSILKGLLLLKQNLKNLDWDRLSFRNEKYGLGSFENILNNNKEKNVKFSLGDISLTFDEWESTKDIGFLRDIEIFSGSTRIAYLLREDDIKGYFEVDYLAFKNIFVIEVREKEIKESKESKLKFKNIIFRGYKDPNQLKYKPELPLFSYEESNQIANIAKFEEAYLNELSKFEIQLNPAEEFWLPLISEFLIQVRNSFSAELNLASARIDKIKKKFGIIGKIGPSINGQLFFTKVEEELKSHFQKTENNLAGISVFKSSNTIQNRYYTNEDSDDQLMYKLLTDFYDATEQKNNEKKIPFVNKWLFQFGITDVDTFFSVEKVESICIAKLGSRNLCDYGFGVSQIVKLVLAVAFGNGTLCLEEPEANLHPNFQSKLADLIIDARKEFWNQNYIIETHSEYFIRKLQYIAASDEYPSHLTNEHNCLIYYLAFGEKPRKIFIGSDGRLSDNFGKGFFDESTAILYSMVTKQQLN